jgi:hypothetical protein
MHASPCQYHAADTPEVCVNILANVHANSDLQARPHAADVKDAHPSPSAASTDVSFDTYRASYGSIRVVPLTWGNDVPPFLHVSETLSQLSKCLYTLALVTFVSQATAHLVIASDCVFKESLVAPFLAVVKRLLSSRGTAIVANEFRSASVHSTFIQVRDVTMFRCSMCHNATICRRQRRCFQCI